MSLAARRWRGTRLRRSSWAGLHRPERRKKIILLLPLGRQHAPHSNGDGFAHRIPWDGQVLRSASYMMQNAPAEVLSQFFFTFLASTAFQGVDFRFLEMIPLWCHKEHPHDPMLEDTCRAGLGPHVFFFVAREHQFQQEAEAQVFCLEAVNTGLNALYSGDQ